eukprot:6211241-Pleurochrysis_carterae.AAC.1
MRSFHATASAASDHGKGCSARAVHRQSWPARWQSWPARACCSAATLAASRSAAATGASRRVGRVADRRASEWMGGCVGEPVGGQASRLGSRWADWRQVGSNGGCTRGCTRREAVRVAQKKNKRRLRVKSPGRPMSTQGSGR